MIPVLYILGARNGDDDWIKFVFGALIFMFWVISAIASALSKKQEKQRRERAQRQLEQPDVVTAPEPAQRKRPVELPPQIAMRMPPAAKPRQPVRAPQRAQPAKQRRVPVKPAAVPTTQLAQPSLAPSIAVASAPPAPAIVKPKPAVATAMSIRRWLTPTTLRQQFVLTEILQPPKALREPET